MVHLQLLLVNPSQYNVFNIFQPLKSVRKILSGIFFLTYTRYCHMTGLLSTHHLADDPKSEDSNLGRELRELYAQFP